MSTLGHSANQPTNQYPSHQFLMEEERPVPTHYLSLRLTVPHSKWDDVLKYIIIDAAFIAFPHDGKGHDNPHFHIFIPCDDTRGGEKYRNRIRKHMPSGGNALYSINFKSNGILNAITYGSREGTQPVLSPSLEYLVHLAPPWEVKPQNIGAYLKKPAQRTTNPDNVKILTYRSLEKAALRHRQRVGITSDQLEDTLESMFKEDWRFDRTLNDRGIPATFFDEFTKQCHGATSWTKNRFLRMRTTETWHLT